MLYQPERHELLHAMPWDESRARNVITQIVSEAEARFSPKTLWPTHPQDQNKTRQETYYMLYLGACGVFWSLRYLEKAGAVQLTRSYRDFVLPMLTPNRAVMKQPEGDTFGSYLMGDTSILLLSYWDDPSPATATRLEELVLANIDHPTREIMWGSPGTLLAALFMHQRTGDSRWADLYRATARKLWTQLEWSAEFGCHYWTQDMYGQRSTYLGAGHGFVATAASLISGRHLLSAEEWANWAERISNTVRRTAIWEGPLANWRIVLDTTPGLVGKQLVQYCHGAPGVVACLAEFPDPSIDQLLLAGGETTWRAGPLNKGSNLCHGTGGNGYAFLKLYRRFEDQTWLEHARAFAMHGIEQTEADRAKYGQGRYSLWTGDLGFAIYLWDCIHGSARFPTLDFFFAD